MSLSCTQINDTTGICSTMEGTGLGLGVFFQYLAASLPGLILILAIIGAVVFVIYEIGKMIGHSVNVRKR